MTSSEAVKLLQQTLTQITSPKKRFQEVFEDFLDYCMLMLSWFQITPAHFQLFVKKYPSKQHQSLFFQAYTTLGVIATNNGDCYRDPFGDIFMQYNNHNFCGQSFTPQDACDLIVHLTFENRTLIDGETVCDPACGSGRLLLTTAKRFPKGKFYGADFDLNCCKMSVINFMLNAIEGEIAWMDTLTLKHWKSWKIKKVLSKNGKYIPYFIEINSNQSHFVTRLKNTFKTHST